MAALLITPKSRKEVFALVLRPKAKILLVMRDAVLSALIRRGPVLAVALRPDAIPQIPSMLLAMPDCSVMIKIFMPETQEPVTPVYMQTLSVAVNPLVLTEP